MRALCPSCGGHHVVVNVLEQGHGDDRKDLYEVAPLETCERTWLTEQDLFEARARTGEEVILADDDDEAAT